MLLSIRSLVVLEPAEVLWCPPLFGILFIIVVVMTQSIRTGLSLFALSVALLAPSLGWAQEAPEVQRGIAAYEEGDFDEAEAAFGRAMSSGVLSRDDYVLVLAHRLLIAQARGDSERVETLALRLASLDPDALVSAMSPQLEEVMERARARADGIVRLEIEHTSGEEGLEVNARVRGDLGALVEEVRLQGRVDGGPWIQGEGGTLLVPEAEAGEVEVVAEAIGPAGVVLAQVGTQDAPERLSEQLPAAATASQPEETGERRLSPVAITLIVVGAVVVAGAAVTLGVVFGTAESEQSRIGGPVVEF